MKRTTKPPAAPHPAGHSRHLNIHVKGMPYTLVSNGDEKIDAREWAGERAPALVDFIMPEDGFEYPLSSDEAGAALMEIISVLVYTEDATDRENMHHALAEAVFNKTMTHQHEMSDFYRRRLIFCPPS